MKKKVLILITLLVMLTTATTAYAADIASGESGSGSAPAAWRLDDTGTLYVSADGPAFMYYAGAPWYEYEPQIHHIIFEEGVTQIDNGLFMFPKYESLKITLPESLCWIGVGGEYDPVSDVKEELELEDEAGLKKDTLFIVKPGTYAEDYVKRMGYKYSYDSGAQPEPQTTPEATEAPTTPPIVIQGKLEYEKYHDPDTNEDQIIITDCSEDATSVDIPSEIDGLPVRSIAEYAFQSCEDLTNITIPNSVTKIGYYAFSGCSSLTDISIPDSITSIGVNAFSYTAYYYNAENWSKGVLYIGNHLIEADPFKINSTYAVKNGTKCIADQAFGSCIFLTSITIPDSVTNIGICALSDCIRLNINVSPQNNNYSSIDGVLFNKDKTELITYAKDDIQPDYIIPDGVISIADQAFGSCIFLTSVTIPNSVTNIGNSAFSGCSGLTGVSIPDSVTSIDDYAFFACNNLTSVTIPDSVANIGKWAFSECGNLNIDVSTQNNNYSSIDGVLFNKDKTELIAYAKDNIQPDYIIPDGVISITDYSFNNCGSLTSVTIPNSVTSIGNYAFEYCRSLISVPLPNSVTSIGDSAFSFCDALTSITIPDSVTSIGSGAFFNTGYYNNTDNWSEGVLYIGNYLIKADPRQIDSAYAVKNGTKCIADQAFIECVNLTSITIPNSVTNIGNSAFYGCSGLTSVTIPDGVTNIGKQAFSECGNLNIDVSPQNNNYSSIDGVLFNKGKTELIVYAKDNIQPEYIIPNGVTSIAECSFVWCERLTSVTMPNSVTTIGDSAFYDCSSLTDVYYSGVEEQWKSINIEEYNEPLTNAAIHLNYNMPVSEVVMQNDIISISTSLDNLIKPEAKEKSEVFVVLYDKNDAVIDTYTAVYDGTDINGTLKNSKMADHIKVFVWNKDGSLEPITDVPEYISL